MESCQHPKEAVLRHFSLLILWLETVPFTMKICIHLAICSTHLFVSTFISINTCTEKTKVCLSAPDNIIFVLSVENYPSTKIIVISTACAAAVQAGRFLDFSFDTWGGTYRNKPCLFGWVRNMQIFHPYYHSQISSGQNSLISTEQHWH